MAALPEHHPQAGPGNADQAPGQPPQRALAQGGGGGYAGSMDQRLTMLEARFDAILPTLATKADVEKLHANLTSEMHMLADTAHKWMIGTTIGLFVGFGSLFLAMTNTLKPAPQALQAAPPQPIIVYLPTPVAASAVPPAPGAPPAK